jgi:hypothetical protein
MSERAGFTPASLLVRDSFPRRLSIHTQIREVLHSGDGIFG